MYYSPKNEIIATIGGSEAVDAVLRSVLNPGDEIIVCEPCYVSYQPLSEQCGASLVHLDTSETEFIPARLLMVCCAADLVPYGLVCRYDKISELENGTWLTVTGTLAVRDYRGSPEPQIDVEKLEPAEAVDAYLYPGI